ncbi:MAG: hypothetical protein ABIH26_05095, partial [Candidatus Eisenbacteria bacterium]
PPPPATAGAEWHGFVEGAYGLRTAEDPAFDGARDYTLEETRAQLRLGSYGERGDAFLQLDLFQDRAASSETDLELREAYLRFGALADHLEVKAGRQALTWGTGDLIFVNDLFPKDWVSFFVGREDQYLKAPADAVRLGIFGLPFDLDVVAAPGFTPDRLPDGTRLSFYAPPFVTGPPALPAETTENGEVALRASRYAGSVALALYGYKGRFKTPAGIRADGVPFYPNLAVYGASARGSGIVGVYWIEAGYYDSEEDRAGSDPLVPNSTARLLAGYEKQLGGDFTLGAQWYGEFMQDHDKHAAGVPAGTWAGDELRQIATVRAEKMLLYHTLRLSLFAFYSPTDEDLYVRPFVSYKVSDEVEVALGGNLFEGKRDDTQFGQFGKNDNIYTRIRYTF